jgi:hydrogenase maturation protein HypF
MRGEARSSRVESAARARLRLNVRGAVQGVGFRPFVYRLARQNALHGFVLNSSWGVVIEVEGDPAGLDLFVSRLDRDKPEAAQIGSLEILRLAPLGDARFTIRESDAGEAKTAVILPDRATCAACRAEIADRGNRRFGYPFTNCIDCGPRYSILRGIPYDRPNTTMSVFTLCPACRREYGDPSDRRFHAQPNACPSCGPRLRLADAAGAPLAGDPIDGAVSIILAGRILALKGIGGFQLLADATRADSVARLRLLKRREEKPFAVMFPSVEAARASCVVEPLEESLLLDAAAPIVLLRPRGDAHLAREVSMSSPYVGALLPYSPLHHLLLRRLSRPVVATSGNRSEEPIATENAEALDRLGGIADAFLWHDRPIARPCDDSVARIVAGCGVVLRRARGYAPLPILARRPLPRILALGAHLKSAVAIAVGRQMILGQHVADLDGEEGRRAFRRAVDDLCGLYAFSPELVACDLHPDYFSTRHAESLGLPLVRVQHHEAHLAACAADNDMHDPYLGVAWDGTGYGPDGTIWGGEFLAWNGEAFTRVARLRPFALVGAESAVRDGRRSAYGLLHQVYGRAASERLPLTEEERAVFPALVERGLNTPLTSSVGRLFDAVAAIAGIATHSHFEGQAAMRLEAAIGEARGADAYPVLVAEGEPLEIDWRPLIAAAVEDAAGGRGVDRIALRFHNALVESIVECARRAGLSRIVLSGGVFQNRYLAENALARLEALGFRVFVSRRVPPNDGGIALGQIVLAARAAR